MATGCAPPNAAALAWLRRGVRLSVVRTGRGSSSTRVFTHDGEVAIGYDDEVVARVYGRDALLDFGWDRTTEMAYQVATGLVAAVDAAERTHAYGAAPPVSIMLHGPPGVAMTVVAHLVAAHLRSDMVQLFASAVLPSSSGGSQPIVAPAVNVACGRRASLLFLDELEALVERPGDIGRQRASNDLLAEALRPRYGRCPVVIGAFAHADDAPPRSLAIRFDHQFYVELPELDDTQASMRGT